MQATFSRTRWEIEAEDGYKQKEGAAKYESSQYSATSSLISFVLNLMQILYFLSQIRPQPTNCFCGSIYCDGQRVITESKVLEEIRKRCSYNQELGLSHSILPYSHYY